MFYRKALGILLIMLTVLSVPAYADRGAGAYKHGVHAEHEGDFDAACGYYKEAHKLSPDNAKYFAAYTQMRFKAATEHVRKGQLLFSSGALKEALTEYQRAVEIDVSDFVAQQEMRRIADMLRRQERQASPKIESPLTKMAAEVGESVELQPISSGPLTFKMAASSDVVYRTLGKLAGINVLIDPDYRPQKITIDLNNVTLLEALDMLRLQAKTFWRPVLPNTIFVSADSPAKRKELEQNVMKTFYLRNVSTPTELQEAASVVGKLLDVNRVQLLQSQDALIVRGTMDQLVLVEKLLTDIDKPKPEVVIDVAVMEVSRDRIRTLGTNVPTSATIYYAPTSGIITSTGNPNSNGSTTNGALTLSAGTFATVVPPVTVTALASDSNGKVLQNPSIRVLNDEKATLRIGDRIPIATGSFQPGVVGAGAVSPLISTQFQYIDVGVNIDITPHIHADHEVTLKMSLEISSVTGEQSIGGITQPIIGQRRIEQETRLADGDVNLLGGILTDSETQSLSGYPWLSKIPILKYLFAQENKQRQQNEIVFAITPHIVRGRDVNEDNVRLVEVGTGNSIELRHKQSAPPPASPTTTAEHPAEPAKRPSAAQITPASTAAPGSSVPAAPSRVNPQSGQGSALAPGSPVPATPSQVNPQSGQGSALAPGSPVPATPSQANPQKGQGAALAPGSPVPATPLQVNPQKAQGAALALGSPVPATPSQVNVQNTQVAALAPGSSGPATPSQANPQKGQGAALAPGSPVPATPSQVNVQNTQVAALARGSPVPAAPSQVNPQSWQGSALAPSSPVPAAPSQASPQNKPATVLTLGSSDLAKQSQVHPQDRRVAALAHGSSGPATPPEASSQNQPGTVLTLGSSNLAKQSQVNLPDRRVAALALGSSGPATPSGASPQSQPEAAPAPSSPSPATSSQVNPQNKPGAAPPSSGPAKPLQLGQPYDLIPF